MSNFSYFASRTPSAMFSKSQKSAMFFISDWAAILSIIRQVGPKSHHHVDADGEQIVHNADFLDRARRRGALGWRECPHQRVDPGLIRANRSRRPATHSSFCLPGV